MEIVFMLSLRAFALFASLRLKTALLHYVEYEQGGYCTGMNIPEHSRYYLRHKIYGLTG
jgi:hypothetical protein